MEDAHPMGHSCFTCRFFQDDEDQEGLCLRFPPPNKKGAFPVMKHWEWCGEYQPSEERVPANDLPPQLDPAISRQKGKALAADMYNRLVDAQDLIENLTVGVISQRQRKHIRDLISSVQQDLRDPSNGSSQET